MKKTGCFFLMIMLCITFMTSLSYAAPKNGSVNKLQVYTVNYPLAYFAQRIAEDHADVFFPAPADEDPAYWMPDAQTIIRYQKADLILLNGANYAKWTAKVSLPRSKMVDTSKGIKHLYIYSKGEVTHSHGPEGEHAHENLAFTTWLDFTIAIEQARAVKKAMARKNPDLKDVFKQNFLTLEKDLMELDKGFEEIVTKNPGLPLIVSHPVYDYLAQRYAINIRSVHWEPHEVPNHAQVRELKSILTNHPSQWMIWEGAPVDDNVSALDSIGLKSLVVSPCANRPEKLDFLAVMQQNLENFKKVYY